MRLYCILYRYIDFSFCWASQLLYLYYIYIILGTYEDYVVLMVYTGIFLYLYIMYRISLLSLSTKFSLYIIYLCRYTCSVRIRICKRMFYLHRDCRLAVALSRRIHCTIHIYEYYHGKSPTCVCLYIWECVLR